MRKKRIYLDYAATTPMNKKVIRGMAPYFDVKFGNPMSVHSFGREASEAVEKARRKVSEILNCQPEEIFFTSGATESNNLAIKGVVASYYSSSGNKGKKPHIITTEIEHHCVLDTCKNLEKEGMAEVSFLKPNTEGVIEISDLKNALRDNTILVSVMRVNNEIGTVQPIEEIGEIIKKRKGGMVYPLFHTDATQGIAYFDSDVKKINVDMLSFSGHKIYAPKGVGVLYVSKNTLLRRMQDGGEQENGMRAGTHNVPGIVGLGLALEDLKKNGKKRAKKISKLRDYLIEKVLREIPESYLNGSLEKRSPNNANFRFEDVEGEGLILLLDMEGIAASTGSACSSGSLNPSHVLLAIGLRHEQAHGSLRLTLGKDTTKEEIDATVKALGKIIAKLRKISGNILESFQ